jgi:hypothetical protein
MESHGDAGRRDGELLRKRDLMVLMWISQQYAARVDQLETLIDRGRKPVYRMVKRLRDAGLVNTRRILVGEPTWVLPTKAGLRACGLGYREVLPSSISLAHVAAINDVRLHIYRQRPGSLWMSEREVATAYGKAGYLPDGVLIDEEHPVAIEVELSVKTIGVVNRKLSKLEQSFDAVLYYCAPGPHRRMSALEKTGRWPKLGVRELPNHRAPRP